MKKWHAFSITGDRAHDTFMTYLTDALNESGAEALKIIYMEGNIYSLNAGIMVRIEDHLVATFMDRMGPYKVNTIS